MPLTLQQYADYLDTRDLSWPAAPDVEKPKAKPHLRQLPNVRAVVWNVYGTLLSISAGELLFEHPQQFVMEIALDKTLQEFKMWGSMTRKPGQPSEYLAQLYQKELELQRMLPSPGEKFPELISEKLWEGILVKLQKKEYVYDVGFFGSLEEYSRKIAYFFHASLQGVAANKGCAEAISNLAAAGLKQGVIGDGQIFTFIQLDRALKAQSPALQLPKLVDPALCVFSYQFRARKPSPRLYRPMLQSLEEKGIGPDETLCVGNSIDKDLRPAKDMGMHTALYAGDKSSLQATKEQLRNAASRPDMLITDLRQISQVVCNS